MRCLRDDVACEHRENKKVKKGGKGNNSSAQGPWLCHGFFSFSAHNFTCSGGGFCPGLGEEELEVAAAGLVGLCCFAKREQEISLN